MIKILSKNAFKKMLRHPFHTLKKGKEKLLVQLATNTLNGYSPFPQNLTFFLTYRCNLRCKVCGQWGDTGYVKNFDKHQLQDEVDLNTLKRMIDEIAPFKPQITLCGGEVLLYKDWFEFMSYVKQKGLYCVLTSNGTLLQEHAEKIIDTGLDKLSFSIDGPEKIHDIARGIDQTYRKAMGSIHEVNRFKKKKKSDKPVLEIGCTISDHNYLHLREIVSIAESLDVSCLIFLHLAFLYDEELKQQTRIFKKVFDTESTQWAGYQYKPDRIDLEKLVKEIEKINSMKYKMPVIVHPDLTPQEILDYYRKPFFTSTSYQNFCVAPWTTAYILPNGDVSPCSNFVAGNIRTESFKSIWNNQKYKYFRAQLKKNKKFPACTRCCELYKH